MYSDRKYPCILAYDHEQDRVAMLVANPLPANYTTDTDTNHFCYGDQIVPFIFGCIDKRRTIKTKQSPTF